MKKENRLSISYGLVFFVSFFLFILGYAFKSAPHFSAGLYGLVLLVCDALIKFFGWETI